MVGKARLASVQGDVVDELSSMKDGTQDQFDSVVRVYGEMLMRDMESKVRRWLNCLHNCV